MTSQNSIHELQNTIDKMNDTIHGFQEISHSLKVLRELGQLKNSYQTFPAYNNQHTHPWVSMVVLNNIYLLFFFLIHIISLVQYQKIH